MIYVDTSVALAQLLAEDRTPPAALWAEPLVSSRLLQYELWNRIHARGLGSSHGEDVRHLLGRIALLELTSSVLARAVDPFPVAVRTLEVTWPEMAKVPVTDGLIAAAGDVSDRNTIRALDALHVASALNVSANSPEDVLFASWDRDQRKAARREGLVLFPAEL